MDRIPALVVENIRQFLSARDIAALSAVNKHWRDCLNQDHVWRPYCDEALGRHLKVTECRVEPRFMSPEEKDSDLSPICESRLSYMREMHLWNNWIHRRFIKEEFGDGGYLSQYRDTFVKFLDSNYVLIKPNCSENVMLWNITGTLSYLTDVITLALGVEVSFCDIIGGKILFIQWNKIQIYRIETSTTEPWKLLGVYNLSTVIDPSSLRTDLITDNVLATGQGTSIELFDLERGETIKVSKVPTSDDKYHVNTITKIVVGEFPKHMAVVLSGYKVLPCAECRFVYGNVVYVYSIEQMSFLDFHAFVRNFTDIYCQLNNEFLAILDEKYVRVYNFLNSELILEAKNLYIPNGLEESFSIHFACYFYDQCIYPRLDKEKKSLVLMPKNCLKSSPLTSYCSGYKLHGVVRQILEGKRSIVFLKAMDRGDNYSFNTAVINKIHAIVMDYDTFLCTFW